MTVNATHVHLSWDPPPSDQINGIIQGYRINITELNTGAVSQYIAEGTQAVIGPLHPHYNYNFTVVAFTLVGHGPTTYVVLRTAEAGMFIATFPNVAIYLSPFSLSSTIQCSRVLPSFSRRSYFHQFVVESPTTGGSEWNHQTL